MNSFNPRIKVVIASMEYLRVDLATARYNSALRSLVHAAVKSDQMVTLLFRIYSFRDSCRKRFRTRHLIFAANLMWNNSNFNIQKEENDDGNRRRWV